MTTPLKNELVKFQFVLDKFSREMVPEMAEVATKKVALDVLRGAVMNTPVDTGRARGNWQVSINTPAATSSAATDKSGTNSLSKGSVQINSLPAPSGTTIWITNNVPYIERLENGWSSQKADGILTPALTQVRTGIFGLGGD